MRRALPLSVAGAFHSPLMQPAAHRLAGELNSIKLSAPQITVVGNVTGRPPFEGTLRHHGWRTARIQLSDTPAGHDPSVIAPAEVEIGA